MAMLARNFTREHWAEKGAITLVDELDSKRCVLMGENRRCRVEHHLRAIQKILAQGGAHCSLCYALIHFKGRDDTVVKLRFRLANHKARACPKRKDAKPQASSSCASTASQTQLLPPPPPSIEPLPLEGPMNKRPRLASTDGATSAVSSSPSSSLADSVGVSQSPHPPSALPSSPSRPSMAIVAASSSSSSSSPASFLIIAVISYAIILCAPASAAHAISICPLWWPRPQETRAVWDSTLTALYLLINARNDLRWELQQASATSEILRTLSEAFSLMAEKNFEAAKRLWAGHCGVSSSRTEWWGELLDVLFKPLSMHPFFRLQQTTVSECSNSACSQPSTSETITWLKMTDPLVTPLSTQIADLPLKNHGRTETVYCGKDHIRSLRTAVDTSASAFFLVEVPERLLSGLSAFPQFFRWPNPHLGPFDYDLGAVICCDGEHYIVYVSCRPSSFSGFPLRVPPSACSENEATWLLCDGRKPAVSRVKRLELPSRSKYTASGAFYFRRQS